MHMYCIYTCMCMMHMCVLFLTVFHHCDKISEITVIEKFCPSIWARWTKCSETTTSQNKPFLFHFFAVYFITATKTNDHKRCKQMLSLSVLADKCLTNVIYYFRDWFHSHRIFFERLWFDLHNPSFAHGLYFHITVTCLCSPVSQVFFSCAFPSKLISVGVHDTWV